MSEATRSLRISAYADHQATFFAVRASNRTRVALRVPCAIDISIRELPVPLDSRTSCDPRLQSLRTVIRSRGTTLRLSPIKLSFEFSSVTSNFVQKRVAAEARTRRLQDRYRKRERKHKNLISAVETLTQTLDRVTGEVEDLNELNDRLYREYRAELATLERVLQENHELEERVRQFAPFFCFLKYNLTSTRLLTPILYVVCSEGPTLVSVFYRVHGRHSLTGIALCRRLRRPWGQSQGEFIEGNTVVSRSDTPSHFPTRTEASMKAETRRVETLEFQLWSQARISLFSYLVFVSPVCAM